MMSDNYPPGYREPECPHDFKTVLSSGDPAEPQERVCVCDLCGEEFDEERHTPATEVPKEKA